MMVFPHDPEQPVAADDPARPPQQRFEQQRFLLAELGRTFARRQSEALGIERQTAGLDLRLFRARRVFAVRPPQMAADLGQHDFVMKRLGNIIVRAVLQRHDLFHLPVARGDEQDRTDGFRPNLPAPVEAVVFRQIDVEQHKLGFGLPERFHDTFEVFDHFGPVAVFFDIAAKQLRDLAIVFHDQNGRHGYPLLLIRFRTGILP